MNADAAIFAIKTLHTAIFLFMSGCILYALWCGTTGRASRRLLPAAILLPSLVGVLWWLNGHECLLSSLIYRLAGGDRSQADIFLPDWIGRWIMPVSTSLLALAIVLIGWRQLAHRWRPRRPSP